MKFPMTLRTRLSLLVLTAIVPLFGLSLISAVRTAGNAVNETTKSLDSSAQLIAANKQRIADSALQVLSAISYVPELLEGKEPVCQRYFKNLISNLPVYTNVGIVGTDGYIRCHSLVNDSKAFAGDRSWFQATMASGSFVASGYLIGRVSGKPIITFALPVKDGDGKIQAVAFAAMFLSEVSKNIASESLPAGGNVLIMDRDGVVLAASSGKLGTVGKPAPVVGVREAIKGSVASVFEGTDVNGARQIYAVRPSSTSPSPPFFVLVSADRSEVLAPARQRLLLNFFALALVALFGSWMAWLLVGRDIVKPAAKILEATGLIQAGALDTRITVRASDVENELSRIASSFNSMAESIQQRDRELSTELSRSVQAQEAMAKLQRLEQVNNAELRETQRKLLDAQKLGRMGHWDFDFSTQVLTWSDELQALFDLAPGSFNGRYETFTQMIHPDDRGEFMRLRERDVRERTETEIEFRIITPNGATRWMHQLGKTYFNEDGTPRYRAGTTQEITARKTSELALAYNMELLGSTGEMAMVGGWELMVGSRQLKYSKQLAQIYDAAPGATLTIDSTLRAFANKARRTLIQAVRAALEIGTPWDMELPMVTAKGRAIWVRSQGRAMLQEGKVQRLTGALQDITEQHASREQLRLLETAVARLNDVVMITEAEPHDEPGPRIVFVNEAFEKHTGYSREEALGRTPRMLQGPNTQRSELHRITQAMKAWQPVRVELINYTKTGEEYWADVEIIPIANGKGWFTHWVSVQRDITQRKAAEIGLIKSEQRYAALFEKAPVPMWVFDSVDHRFLNVNRIAVENYGYSAEEFRAMTIFDIRDASEGAALRNHLREREPDRPYWQHRRKDGTLLMVNVVAKAIQYEGREACFVIAQDITAQVNAEKGVQEQILMLRRTADAAQAITWQQTIDEMLQEVADQARFVIKAHQSAISLTVDHDPSQPVSALSLSEKYAAARDTQHLQGGHGLYARLSKNNGAVRMTQAELEAHPHWLEIKSYTDLYPARRGLLLVPMRGRQGRNMGLLQLSDKNEGEFTLQDEYVATELAQLASIAIENTGLLDQVHQLNTGLEKIVTERTLALSRQEALFRAVAEQAPQVIWTSDSRGVASYYNRAWFDLVGGTPEDWVGHTGMPVTHPEDRPEVRANWIRAVTTRSPFVGIRRLMAQDGSYHVMSYRASPVLDEGGEISFWVGIDADITELKSTESALRLSNQELEAFSYSVSHDLRAPLNTIDGFSRLLAKQIEGEVNSKAQHYLTRIQAGVAQMGQLIEDLLSLAQVSRAELHLEQVDVSLLSRRILDEWQVRAPHRQVEFHIDPDLVARGDVRLLRVLMENLLGNAWKFTAQLAHANITVGQQLDANGLPVFFVRDDGVGFDMAYADKLFVVFQRLHPVTEFPGTGVGLATVGRVIARHEGQLWADAAPGKGATFFFTLPKAPLAH